jgi:adenylate cyclase
MTTQEEIEQLKIRIARTTDENEVAPIILELLKKYALVDSPDSEFYAVRLLELAEKMESLFYQAWGHYYLAFIKRISEEYGASITQSKKALALFSVINDREGLAKAYNNIAIASYDTGNYTEAVKNQGAALQINIQLGDKRGIAGSHINIGVIYYQQGNYPEAMKNYFEALHIMEEISDKRGIANLHNNIGVIYEKQGDYKEALENHFRALKISEQTEDKRGIANSHNSIGVIYRHQHNYGEALKNHLLAVEIWGSIGNKWGLAGSYNDIGTVYEEEANYTEALNWFLSASKIAQEIGDKYQIAALNHSIGEVYSKQGNHLEAVKYKLVALKGGEEINNKELVKEASFALFSSYKSTHDFENALKHHEKYHQVESEMLGEQAQKQLTNLNFQHNLEQKEKDLEIEQLRNVELKKEKDRSESLLLNILPGEVAEELKETGGAEARLFDNVTVLFTDFKGFTTVSEKLTPQQLVDELHACFSAFDEITGKYNIEKIKTVGDAYLAVSGLPLANLNHAEDLIRAAIEIRDFMVERARDGRRLTTEDGKNRETFEIRIGIHSGSVVAGIVGVKKFAYDIWGDTVNTAARMEQNSEAGKINISQSTYELVKDKFNCEYRGEIEAKNKGKLKMYFVY